MPGAADAEGAGVVLCQRRGREVEIACADGQAEKRIELGEARLRALEHRQPAEQPPLEKPDQLALDVLDL